MLNSNSSKRKKPVLFINFITAKQSWKVAIPIVVVIILFKLHDVMTEPPPKAEREGCLLCNDGQPKSFEQCLKIDTTLSGQLQLKTEHGIKIPCDKIPDNSILEGAIEDVSVILTLIAFDNNQLIPLTNLEVQVNDIIRTDRPVEIVAADYIYPLEDNTNCMALIKVTALFPPGKSLGSNYDFVFYAEDSVNQSHNFSGFERFFSSRSNWYHTRKCRIINGNSPDLSYYRCLDTSSGHISHHVAISSLSECSVGLE